MICKTGLIFHLDAHKLEQGEETMNRYLVTIMLSSRFGKILTVAATCDSLAACQTDDLDFVRSINPNQDKAYFFQSPILIEK